MKKALPPRFFALLLSTAAFAQTTTLTQTSLTCSPFFCSNATLSDTETFAYYIATSSSGPYSSLTFRGITYYDLTWSCGISACTSGETSQVITANQRQLSANELFNKTRVFRSHIVKNTSGSLALNYEYFTVVVPGNGFRGIKWAGKLNPTSSVGQAGLAVAKATDTIVALVSSAPEAIQVPASVTIKAGTLYANFTVTANNPVMAATTVTVTGSFPDGTSRTFTMSVNPDPTDSGNDN